MKRWIVTFFGVGLIPGAPGTYASFATGAVLYAIGRSGLSGWGWTSVLIAGLVLSGGLCVMLGPWAINYFRRKDPGPVVIDETAGVCLTMLLLPEGPAWRMVLTAVVAFRFFDILKPPPVRQLERLPAGWGILMDDLMAGVYANLVCQVILRWIV